MDLAARVQPRRGARSRPGEAIPVADLPMPSGWFALATSAELPPGTARAARLAGEELVVWRSASGIPSVASAWCPHLGAHLGETGHVRGELIECGFHGFCFDTTGACRATSYGHRPPSRAALRTWPVRESAGAVFAWYDRAGRPPGWLPPDLDHRGWTPIRWHRQQIVGHPLETTENSVDVGHLAFLHGYRNVAVIEPAEADGPVLRARYAMTRARPAFGIPLPPMRTEFDVVAYGLGYSQVELHVLTLGVRLRLFVLATPSRPAAVELRTGTTARLQLEPGAPPVVAALPAGLVARAVRDFTAALLRFDVGQDRQIWYSKRHVPHPVLAEGDGPIGLYRRWAAQFLEGEPRAG